MEDGSNLHKVDNQETNQGVIQSQSTIGVNETAISKVITPNKSVMEREQIKDPYSNTLT